MRPEFLRELLKGAQPMPRLIDFPTRRYDPEKDTTCFYCLGRGKVYGGGLSGLFSAVWWRLGGSLWPQRCPECNGTGNVTPKVPRT